MEGNIHYSVPELLDLAELPDTPQNQERVFALLHELLDGEHVVERRTPTP